MVLCHNQSLIIITRPNMLMYIKHSTTIIVHFLSSCSHVCYNHYSRCCDKNLFYSLYMVYFFKLYSINKIIEVDFFYHSLLWKVGSYWDWVKSSDTWYSMISLELLLLNIIKKGGSSWLCSYMYGRWFYIYLSYHECQR
jgi:hypothetical protein